MKNNKVYKANPSFILRKIAGDNVLISVGDGVASFSGIISLNESAKTMWECLQIGATESDLINSLCDAYEVSQEHACEDVKNVLSILIERGLVTVE